MVPIGNVHHLAIAEATDPQHGVALTDRDGRIMALARSDRNQSPTCEFSTDVELLVARIDRLGVGNHPHLDEVDVVGRAGVLLRMPDPATGAHALRQPRIDQPLVALGVLVLQLTVEDPGDDLHVSMGMRLEAGATGNTVVVQHQELPVVGVVGVMVPTETERMLGIEPAGPGMGPLAGTSNIKCCHDRYNVRSV